MKLSTERILTTHVGSLPRPPDVSDMLLAKENETLGRPGRLRRLHGGRRGGGRAPAGGRRGRYRLRRRDEQDRLLHLRHLSGCTAFRATARARCRGTWRWFPAFVQRVVEQGEAPQVRRAPCVGEISIKDEEPLRKDLANMAAALDAAGAVEGFHERGLARRHRVSSSPTSTTRARTPTWTCSAR